MPTTRTPITGTGGWVKFLRDNGNPHLVRDTYAAKVTGNRSGELTLHLYNKNGGTLNTTYWVPNDGTYVEVCDKPEFTPLLADIPNTPELQAAKDVIFRLFTKYGRTNGYDALVQQALLELGIEKPNAGKVEATVSFTVKVDVDKLNPESDTTTFKEWFDKLSTAERLLALAKQAKAAAISINYEVKPNTPAAADRPPAKA